MKQAISCDNESLVLSNERSPELWGTFQTAIKALVREAKFAPQETLLAWKEPHHLATAKESYSWRAALEELKNSDLPVLFKDFRGEEDFVLMTDKPTMLKIGGEVTNSVLHSYTLKHRITFGQITSNEPSFLAR